MVNLNLDDVFKYSTLFQTLPLRVKSLKETIMDMGEFDSTSGEAANSEGKVPVVMNDDEHA